MKVQMLLVLVAVAFSVLVYIKKRSRGDVLLAGTLTAFMAAIIVYVANYLIGD